MKPENIPIRCTFCQSFIKHMGITFNHKINKHYEIGVYDCNAKFEYNPETEILRETAECSKRPKLNVLHTGDTFIILKF